MLKKTKKGFYVLEKFSQIPNLLHGFSTVDFGNMSNTHGERERVLANRARFARTAGINPKNIISVRQKHGTNILNVNSASSISEHSEKTRFWRHRRQVLIKQTEKIAADGLITNQKDVCLLIKTADCLSILLFDPQKEVIGLIHAGRQGIINKIHFQAIDKMKKDFGSQSKDICVGLGPAICYDCYHGKIDLTATAARDFLKIGVLRKNIEKSNVCVFENKDFYSHQRSKILGEPEKRFATIYEIKSD